MAVYTVNGKDFKCALQRAVAQLQQLEENINSLNVFPVPDGDTGTNMLHTMKSALKQAEVEDSEHLSVIVQKTAKGALLGARGNSGVILSQFLQGFALSLKERETAGANEIVRAFQEGSQVACRAVLKPVEGTILTIIREFAESAAENLAKGNNLVRILAGALNDAEEALQKTPQQLPILKEAGVVDAGGRGFIVILEGAISSFSKFPLKVAPEPEEPHQIETENQYHLSQTNFTQGLAYCTEFLVKGKAIPLQEIRKDLELWGDCLLVVGEDDLAKVHIHTDHPGQVMENCLHFGSLHDIKINNMVEQHEEFKKDHHHNHSQKNFSTLSVASGKGLIEIMRTLGADVVLAGGQTFNPSAGEILHAVENLPSSNVIILPNNSNIIHAAEQAGKLSAKEVVVIPTKSIPQGLTALISCNTNDNLVEASEKMNKALGNIQSGEITRAVRDASCNGLKIRKNDFIGIWEGNIITAGTDMAKVLEDLFLSSGIFAEEGKLITLYTGIDVDNTDAERIYNLLCQKYPNQDFEIYDGGQPVYDMIISLE